MTRMGWDDQKREIFKQLTMFTYELVAVKRKG